METYVAKWLLDVVGPKLKKDQYGALKGSSTTYPLIELLHQWYKDSEDHDKFIRIVLINFQKAFNRINHFETPRQIRTI